MTNRLKNSVRNPVEAQTDKRGGMPAEQNNHVLEGVALSAPKLDGFSAGSLGQSAPEASEPSAEELFEILSNSRRRYVAYFLKHCADTAELGTLSTQIAAWENDKPVAEVTRADRKRVYTSLQQVHLPKMDEIGVVGFDKRAGLIESTPSLESVEFKMTVTEEDRSVVWYRYYLFASAAGLVFWGIVAARNWGDGMVSNVGLLGIGIALLLLLVTVHRHYVTEERSEPTD